MRPSGARPNPPGVGADQGGAGRPNPEVVARARRRIFTAEYKQRVLAEADKAKEESGGIGPCSGVRACTPRTW